MAGPLVGKTVVVTGASSGVGRALARAFGRARAKVALLARSEEALLHAALEVHALGGEAWTQVVDVADAAAVERFADEVAGLWGRIDVWINCAMVTVLSPVRALRAEEVRRVTEVNYLGTVHGTQAALRHMEAQGGGIIIQIGSALVYRSIPLQAAYCASKAAIRGFTDSLRSELLHDRSPVKLCMLQLPAVNTPQFEVMRTRLPKHPQPVPPIYEPEVIARAVLEVAERPVRERWLGWSSVRAIVGQRVVPGWLDRYLAKRGYEGQQAPMPVEPNRADNLFAPVPGDRGARGEFGDRARDTSVQMWMAANRRALGVALAVLGVGATAGAWWRARRHG